MTVLPLSVRYLDAVTALEKMGGDVHWSRLQFEKELGLPVSRMYVLAHEEEVFGYGGFWKIVDEAQITNLVIHPGHRRQRLGRRLLKYLMDQARQESCRRGTLEVRAGNFAAQSLYHELGFKVVGRRPKVYERPVEDAVLMEKIF